MVSGGAFLRASRETASGLPNVIISVESKIHASTSLSFEVIFDHASLVLMPEEISPQIAFRKGCIKLLPRATMCFRGAWEHHVP